MTDGLDGVRNRYPATDLTTRSKTALTVLGWEDHQLTPQQLGADIGPGVGEPAELAFDGSRFDAALRSHVAMKIYDRARLYRQSRGVPSLGGRFATFDAVSTNT
jgi:hypothetical protein